jgi:hypothetical protein
MAAGVTRRNDAMIQERGSRKQQDDGAFPMDPARVPIKRIQKDRGGTHPR